MGVWINALFLYNKYLNCIITVVTINNVQTYIIDNLCRAIYTFILQIARDILPPLDYLLYYYTSVIVMKSPGAVLLFTHLHGLQYMKNYTSYLSI